MEKLEQLGEDYIPELGNGFDERIKGNPEGLPVANYFVPASGEGIYQISYRVEVLEDVDSFFLFAGRKQLLRQGSRKKGDVVEGSVYLHFGEIIPRYHKEPMEITKIGFAVSCEDMEKIGNVEMTAQKLPADTKNPVVYLAGDSTMTDQTCEIPYIPGGCYSSWGQELAYYIGQCAAVDNQAHSGLSTEAFRGEGHFGIVQKFIRPGDYCLFQFGHNDQKLPHLQARTGYRDNLIRFVDEVREKGGIPVLITPLARNTWKPDGTYNDLLKDHAESVFEIGEELEVPVLDLHKFAMDLILKNGKEASRVYFHPGDYTHPNEFGSYLFAGFIASALEKTDAHTFQAKCLDEKSLKPDEGAGSVTGATANRNITSEQKETFDAMEKSEEALLAAVAEAKEQASARK